MQARQPSFSSLAPPSSPPPALWNSGEANSPSDAGGRVSPTWTAPSPTRTLGHSSPELPSLPALSLRGSHPRTPSTVARNDKTDTSYYTASWGSPYRHPPPSLHQQRQASTSLSSDDFEGDSSLLQFGLEHLLPSRLEIEEDSPNQFSLEHLIPRFEQNASPVQFSLENLIRSRVPNLETPTREAYHSSNTPRPSDSNPTSEEWVRRFLEERWDQSANKWLSEDGLGSETDVESTKDQDVSIEPPQKRGHRSRSTNKTLNQEEFWRHFSADQKEVLGKMMASKYADPEAVSRGRLASGSGTSSSLAPNGNSTPAEKSLPTVPTLADSPKLGENLGEKAENSAVQPAQQTPSTITPDAPSKTFLAPPEPVRMPSRNRKKMIVKGKGCIISIPRDIPRGHPGYPPKPMTAEAVEAKFQQLERRGHDVRGFSTGGVEPHNRTIWPEEADVREERANTSSQFRVRISKKAEWDDYVNSLVEAKLAALGVSLGGEEDIPLPLSRQTSSQAHPGNPFSPPLPTSSAGSHRMARQGSIVSGSFPLGPSPGHMSRQSIASPGHMSRQSIASPAAFANPRTSMHMHRHSTFASPTTFGHRAMSPSGTWSPGGYFGSQDGRSGSPALSLSRPDLSGLVSPHSPFGMRSQQQFPITAAQKEEYLLQMQIQQQQLQAQLLQQQHQQQQQQLLGMRPSSTLAEVPEDEDEEDEVPSMKHVAKPVAPEIAVPTPRGHRHNISQNLEREAASEEYHLEQAIDKQFAEGGDFSTEPEIKEQPKPSQPVANSTWEESRPVLHQPQPHSRAHSLAKSQSVFAFPAPQNPRTDSSGAQTNDSENTNPSLEGGEVHDISQSSAQHSQAPSHASVSWKDNKFAFSKPSSAAHSKHTSRSSISKLNVEAKEFKFNPAASFSFGFTPATNPPADVSAPHSTKASVDTVSSFNVSAPVFKPDAPTFKPEAPVFKPVAEAPVSKPAVDAPEIEPSGMNGTAFPSSGFSFSSPPSFKPDAPVFNPGVSAFNPSKAAPTTTSFSSKIFGDVNISASDIIKPASRSKAIPIVRPDVTRQKTPEKEEEREDEAGRPMPIEGREKRARREQADGDDVPKFALQPILASQPLADVKQPQMVGQGLKFEHEDIPEDKENLSPDGKRAKSKSKSPEPLSVQRSVPVSEPTPQLESSADILADEQTPNGSDLPTPTTEEPTPLVKEHAHKSTLSANAKPFEFRSQLNSAVPDFGFHVTKPSQVDDLKKSHMSPSRLASRSPASTYRPSDDGSYKTALDSRRHITSYPESENADFDNLGGTSFNDIDAVMKQMNEGGSDFGVERDDNSWERSSQGTPDQFTRNDLRPTLNLRSDAPSPSPRRLYPSRNMGGSGTSGQDPFDDERAAISYESPVHRLNNADEVPMSDWDEGLLSEGEDRIQTRSRFFDKHVDELMGRLLQSRLGPLEQNLQGIQDSLEIMSQRPSRGRRSLSTNERLDSDADDEDDDIGTDSHYRNRSPKKDKKLQKIRSIVREALEIQQSHMSVSAPTAEHVPAEQIRAIVEEAIASTRTVAPEPATETIKTEDIRSIITEALASHQPLPSAPPAAEPVQPDMIRSIVAEALASHKPATLEAPVDIPQPQVDMSEIYQVIGSLKASIAQTTSQHLKADDVRDLVDDAFRRQTAETAEREEVRAISERDARIARLEEMLKETTARLDAEVVARQALETREAESARILKVTEEEVSLLQQAATEDEDKIRALTQDRDALRLSLDTNEMKEDDLRESLSSFKLENEDLKLKNESLRKKLEDVTAQNEALSSTLEEHRLSATKWRGDIQDAREESEGLRKAIDQARYQAEEAIRVRESMRSKFEQLQQDMVAASQQVAAERAEWQRNEEGSLTKYEVLSARIEAEGRTRERLERELERLETQEREGMRLRIHLEQTQKHNARLEETIEQLREESSEHQRNAERYERDMREARDAAHVEIRRTRVLMEADIDAANNQVNIVRHELESEIGRVRAELDQVRLDADTANEKHELDLEAASDVKKQAVHEAHEIKQQALQEQQRTFERQIEQIKHEHARALDFAHEDKKRADAFNDEKLALADSKLDHFKDKIALLEEKLQVAKEAASAAAAAASKSSNAGSSHGSAGPEKISAQALRESIAVLQEQLQEREARIEALEHELAESDTEAPAKLKERDTEINWLRELLGVRIDDLNDLINSLAQPTFDRETVRDAAIRIRTNLQMEQSEKERLISGGQQSFPTLSTLSNFASPKAVQIAAAFGNWRKGRGEAASALAGSSAANSRNQTPSRPSQTSSQSFLSGLMTPPTSNLRRTPDVSSLTSNKRSQELRSNSVSSRTSTEAGFPILGKQSNAPRTPPLMRKTSYDQDAEVEPFSESGFYDDESTIDGEMTPLALNFGRELPR